MPISGERRRNAFEQLSHFKGWLNCRPVSERDVILTLFEGSFPELLRYAVQNFHFKMDVLEVFVVKQACDLLQGLIPSRDDKEGGCLERIVYERLYVFALMWSVGAFLELDDRAKMESFLRLHDVIVLDLPKIRPETDDTMFDFMVNSEGSF